MRKKYRVFIVLALYTIVILIFTLFFLLGIDNLPLFLVLSFGSVTVLSTSTVYTIIQSNDYNERRVKKKQFIKPKSIKQKAIDIIEDYFDAMPAIEEYVESYDSYEAIPIINKYIFTVFSQEELDKINLLDLSKMDKILFIREMLYFNQEERSVLIETMLKNRDNTDLEGVYSPPVEFIDASDQIRVYIRSLVEAGEKTKIIIINTADVVTTVKKRVGVLFDYDLENFLLSSGGIILRETAQIKDYDIIDDDEIALIPSRHKERN